MVLFQKRKHKSPQTLMKLQYLSILKTASVLNTGILGPNKEYNVQ